MAARTRDEEVATEDGEVPEVVRLRTSPDRYVFTERGNTDGWIATDSVVELDP